MSTIRKSTKATHAAVHATVASEKTGTTPNLATPTPVAATPGLVLVPLPPSIAAFPTPPDGYTATDPTATRGVQPKSAQLAVMPEVIKELLRFTDYAEVFGKTAPPLASVLQTFQAAAQWSAMRVKSDTWEAFTRSQEGMSWRDVYAFMERMQPAFELAVQGDSSVGTLYPMIARLFGAQKLIAQKAVATKKANKKLAAEGKLPVKGAVGKRRKKAAANAALEERAAAVTAVTAPATSAETNGVSAATAAAAASGGETTAH